MASAKNPGNNNQRRFAVAAIVILIIAGASYWIYSNRPGAQYKKLENQFESLNLPADWKETGARTGEKDGWFGMCRDVTITCPAQSRDYSAVININNEDALELMSQVINKSGFDVRKTSGYCRETINQTPNEFKCFIAGEKNSLRITVSKMYSDKSVFRVNIEG